MRTRPYEVEYEDGRVRVKMLSADGAERVGRQGDVVDVRLPEDAPGDQDEQETAADGDTDGDGQDTGDEGAGEDEKQAPTRRNKSRRPTANK